jgi:ATPase family AAA domain-containing protein 3A/B
MSNHIIRILTGFLVIGSLCTPHTSICMQPKKNGMFAQAGRAVGTAASDFFQGTTAIDYKSGDVAKVVNRVAKELNTELRKINAGPAMKEFNQWITNNRKAVIKWAILGTLGSAALTATAIGMQYATYYIWKYGSEIVAKYILIRMEKPRVIINSSTQEQPGYIKRLYNFVLKKKPAFAKMIFAPELEQQLQDEIKQTVNINTRIRSGKKNVTYRNLLLWGPPGTGKTMFARQLARQSNLEWVEITGSSLFTKGAGIAAIDELFEWANKSKRGLLIFIDEADSLLPDRTKIDPNSDNYKIINHFLNYLGTKSSKFMIVMSTNHKIVFDAAMRRRIHDSIHLPLPGLTERVRLLELYAEKTLFDAKQNSEEFVTAAQKEVNNAIIQEIAGQTEGFSNDEVATLIETIKSLADISDAGMVTHEIVQRAVKQQVAGREGFTTA